MILDAIFNFIASIFGVLIDFLPVADTSVGIGINTAMTTLRNGLVSVNWIFPVDTLLFLLQISFYCIAVIFLIKIYRWIFSNLTAGLFK
jgi:hypothetical protein